MADHTIVIEIDRFNPDSVTVLAFDNVIFRLAEGRRETVVAVLQGGSASTTLFGQDSVNVGSTPATVRVIEGANGTYDIEAPAQEGGTEDGDVRAGKGTIKGTIKVGGGGVE